MTNKLPEHQYLDLLRRIKDEGDFRIDRTGVGTKAIFGTTMRFDLSDGSIPLLTTKKINWKAPLIEMLWFLTGETNIKPLIEQGVHIWTDWPLARYRMQAGENISRDAFEARILEDASFAEEWGDLGPVYGSQWRRWPTKNGGSIDQIAKSLDLLRDDPYSRRNLFHAWNVEYLDQMALAPCHMTYQFLNTSDGKVSLCLSQRSCDFILGNPYNLAGATILLRMMAQQADLDVGELIWMGGDTHLYANHMDAAETQLSREPKPFPKLIINKKPDSIDDYRVEDFEVIGYDPAPFIKAPVAV